MGQIFVAKLAGVCSKRAGQLWLWSDRQILVTRWENGVVKGPVICQSFVQNYYPFVAVKAFH